MYTPDELLKLFNDYLEKLPYERQPRSLYEPIIYTLSRGGKRIRPMLMLIAYNMFRDDPQAILSQAAAIETYHNYTLLHDDLMDNADVRRGCPTVHKKWDANTAILSGDAMLILAYQRMGTNSEVLQLFTETALQIGEGQQYDMDFEHRNDVAEEEYIEMIRLKTSVLLACSMQIGAILAGAEQSEGKTLYTIGESLGLAFQLQDDLLDVYGNPAVFGKAIGGDITSNKKTFMLIKALELSVGEQHAELVQWINRETFDREEKIAAVTQIYNNLGIRQICQAKIDSYFSKCETLLDTLDVEGERKEALRQYIYDLMKRQR